MSTELMRGSEKVIAAWEARALTEESVAEIARHFEESSGTVEAADVVGGAQPTGLRLGVSYDGDDVPQCGNDIAFWLKWLLNHGGVPTPPRIIINGIPIPDVIRMELDFGHVAQQAPTVEEIAGALELGG